MRRSTRGRRDNSRERFRRRRTGCPTLPQARFGAVQRPVFNCAHRRVCSRHLSRGNALVASLHEALARRGITLWLDTPMRSLQVEGERVSGSMRATPLAADA
ncbi:FAD-binding protein [Burkholderia seminalis]|uniref:FAD-binding protein n=1 Tax=Burkholderia seminalis TaxID=488731 RepID=UPI00345467BA